MVFDRFVDIITKSRESEIDSLVSETYPEIENIKDPEIALNIIKISNAYQISTELITYNIFDEFKNVDEFYVGVFFDNIKTLSKFVDNKNKLTSKVLTIIELLNNNNFVPPDSNITKNRMTKYQKLINYRGNKLRSKLYRLVSFAQDNQKLK